MATSVCRWYPAVFLAVFAVPACAQDNDWRPYEFEGTEAFRYEVTHTEDDEVTTGFYALKLTPAAQGRVTFDVEAQLGEIDCTASVTAERRQLGPQYMWTGCMMMAPVLMAVHTPMAMWFMGRSFERGDHWEMRHGDESLSFRVESECSHAGQDGMLAVVKENDELRLRACVATDVVLPLAVTWRDNGDTVDMTLVEYRQ